MYARIVSNTYSSALYRENSHLYGMMNFSGLSCIAHEQFFLRREHINHTVIEGDELSCSCMASGQKGTPRDSDSGFFDRLTATQHNVLELKRVDILAETMELNDLNRQYADIVFFVLGLILSVTALIVINIIGVRSTYPSLFCWWNTYYKPALKKPFCKSELPDGVVPKVTATSLAMQLSYPTIFNALNTLTVYESISPNAAEFLLLCVHQNGPRITPLHWRGTPIQLGWEDLLTCWLPVNRASVVGSVQLLVDVWNACPGPGSLPSSECIQNDLNRIFDNLGQFGVGTDMNVCARWQSWLVYGCPPGGWQSYPYLPFWQRLLNEQTNDVGTTGWPIGWVNSRCVNPFFSWFAPFSSAYDPNGGAMTTYDFKEQGSETNADTFLQIASVLEFLLSAQMQTQPSNAPSVKESALGTLYNNGLVALALQTAGQNTQNTAPESYAAIFEPATGYVVNKPSNCDAAAAQDGISAGMAAGLGVSFLPGGQIYKSLVIQPKRVEAWQGVLDISHNFKTSDASGGVLSSMVESKGALRGGGLFSRATLAEELAAQDFGDVLQKSSQWKTGASRFARTRKALTGGGGELESRSVSHAGPSEGVWKYGENSKYELREGASQATKGWFGTERSSRLSKYQKLLDKHRIHTPDESGGTDAAQATADAGADVDGGGTLRTERIRRVDDPRNPFRDVDGGGIASDVDGITTDAGEAMADAGAVAESTAEGVGSGVRSAAEAAGQDLDVVSRNLVGSASEAATELARDAATASRAAETVGEDAALEIDDTTRIIAQGAEAAEEATRALEWAEPVINIGVILAGAALGVFLGFKVAAAEKKYCDQFNHDEFVRQPFQPQCILERHRQFAWTSCVCMQKHECCMANGEQAYPYIATYNQRTQVTADVCKHYSTQSPTRVKIHAMAARLAHERATRARSGDTACSQVPWHPPQNEEQSCDIRPTSTTDTVPPHKCSDMEKKYRCMVSPSTCPPTHNSAPHRNEAFHTGPVDPSPMPLHTRPRRW